MTTFRTTAHREIDMHSSSAAAPSARELIDRMTALGFAPRFLPDGTPCAVEEQGACPHRVFVASIPKAGTYLLAEALAALGVRPTRLHIDVGAVSDYRDFRKGSYLWDYQFNMTVDDALRLVQPGQFAVGHLPSSDEIRRPLAGFRIVFALRELRHAFVSWARFVVAESMDRQVAEAARQLPDGPDRVLLVLTRLAHGWLVPVCRAMLGWYTDPGVLPVRFEDLVGQNGPDTQAEIAGRLAAHLGLPIPTPQAVAVVRGCIGRDTLTFSGSRSDLSTHWDDRLEDWFRSVGGADLNRELGYYGAPHPCQEAA